MLNLRSFGAFGLASLAFTLSSTAFADTKAYWRFENGPAGSPVNHGAANGVWAPDIADSSGHGNALSVWDTGGGGGYKYSADVPYGTVPQTNAANHFSVQNTGGGPAMWNNTLRNWAPSAFTIEATFKPENGGHRTIVGRDSIGAGTQGGANTITSALYFKIAPDNSVRIEFQDVSGYEYGIGSAPNAVTGFDWPTDHDGLKGHWYSMAGVSDGKVLSLYLDDLGAGTGYQLVAQTQLNKGSLNTALSTGAGSGSDWQAGNFSVGRGLFNGGHVDRAYGFIDEVRLSEGALGVNQFLASPVPEPASMLALGLGFVAVLRRRRSK